MRKFFLEWLSQSDLENGIACESIEVLPAFQHPQHGAKVISLPKGHFAAIAGQRGRLNTHSFD